MSRNGGYAIMDLKGYAFTSGTAKNVDLSLFAITQRDKPILISGLKVGDTLYPDFYATFTSTTVSVVTSAAAEKRLHSATMTIVIQHDSGRNLTSMTVTVTADT